MNYRSTLLFLISAQALLAACVRHPCPEGDLAATLFIDNSDIEASGLGYGGPRDLGTLGQPHPDLMTCTSIRSLTFTGSISGLEPFAAVEQLGELFIVDGVNEDELTGLPNMRALGALTVRGRVEELNVFSALEVAGTLSFSSGRASFVAPNLTRAASLTGGGVPVLLAPLMEEVDFDLEFDFGQLNSLEGLPALRYIGGDLELQGLAIEELHLNAVEEVGGNIIVGGNRNLVTWGFESLQTVNGGLFIISNPSLSSASLSAWTDNVVITGETLICENLATPETPDDCPPPPQ